MMHSNKPTSCACPLLAIEMGADVMWDVEILFVWKIMYRSIKKNMFLKFSCLL
jgi:hypothetical protein